MILGHLTPCTTGFASQLQLFLIPDLSLVSALSQLKPLPHTPRPIFFTMGLRFWGRISGFRHVKCAMCSCQRAHYRTFPPLHLPHTTLLNYSNWSFFAAIAMILSFILPAPTLLPACLVRRCLLQTPSFTRWQAIHMWKYTLPPLWQLDFCLRFQELVHTNSNFPSLKAHRYFSGCSNSRIATVLCC